MSTPNLERMYECGDALANVKDKNYAEVIFVLYYVPDNCFPPMDSLSLFWL